MSDSVQSNATPQLGPQEHRPHRTSSENREAFRELIAGIAQDRIWANRLQIAMDDAKSWEIEAAEIEERLSAAHRHSAERGAKIAELEARIASHVCAGPTTINLTENAAVQEFTAELRRELAEERNHVRQHKATIDAKKAVIEKLREQIRQAQQDAGNDLAPWSAERKASVRMAVAFVRNALGELMNLARNSDNKCVLVSAAEIQALRFRLTFESLADGGNGQPRGIAELETIRAAEARMAEESVSPAPDFMATRDSVVERLGRVKELLHTGPYDQVGREIEEALKELAGVPF